MILVIIAVIWFFLIHPVYALSPPILSDPSNNSVIYSGPKLSWQAVIDSMGYKIMIDDESSITSPYTKTPYYTENTYYSPKLNSGSYYWKVGAKDNNGTWFWSDVWSFTLSAASSSPTPSPTPSPSSSSSTSPASSLFTISNLPAQINSDQSFSISVNLSLPNNPNTTYYLAGAFKIAGGNRYFGLTKSGSDWIKYNSENFSNQYKITTNSSGTWTGNLEIKPDTSDSDYKGSGDYVFKIARYTQAGSQTWSNEADIKIISTEIEEQGDVSTSDTPSSATNPSSSSQSNPKKNISLSQTSSKVNYNVASIAGTTTTTASSAASSVEVKNQKQINRGTIPLRGINYFFWLGIIFVFAGIGSLGYIYLRRNGTVFNKFRKRN